MPTQIKGLHDKFVPDWPLCPAPMREGGGFVFTVYKDQGVTMVADLGISGHIAAFPLDSAAMPFGSLKKSGPLNRTNIIQLKEKANPKGTGFHLNVFHTR